MGGSFPCTVHQTRMHPDHGIQIQCRICKQRDRAENINKSCTPHKKYSTLQLQGFLIEDVRQLAHSKLMNGQTRLTVLGVTVVGGHEMNCG